MAAQQDVMNSSQVLIRPKRVTLVRVVHTASNNRVSWVGRQVVVTMTDDSVERCEHTSGHRTEKAARACAQRIVDRVNRAAGIDPRSYKQEEA